MSDPEAVAFPTPPSPGEEAACGRGLLPGLLPSIAKEKKAKGASSTKPDTGAASSGSQRPDLGGDMAGDEQTLGEVVRDLLLLRSQLCQLGLRSPLCQFPAAGQDAAGREPSSTPPSTPRDSDPAAGAAKQELVELIRESVRASVREVGEELTASVATAVAQAVKPILQIGFASGSENQPGKSPSGLSKGSHGCRRGSTVSPPAQPSRNNRHSMCSVATMRESSHSQTMSFKRSGSTLKSPSLNLDCSLSFGLHELDMMHTDSLIAQDAARQAVGTVGRGALTKQRRSSEVIVGDQSWNSGLNSLYCNNDTHLVCVQPDTSGFDMDALREDQERSIVRDNLWSFSDIPTLRDEGSLAGLRGLSVSLVHFPSWALRLFGVIPPAACRPCRWYGNLVLIMIGLFVAYSAILTFQKEFSYVELTDVFYGMGAFLALLALKRNRIHDLFGSKGKTLEAYASNHGFDGKWERSLQRWVPAVGGLWLCELAMQACLTFNFTTSCTSTQGDITASYRFVFSCLVSTLFSTLACVQLHVCSCLQLMVDEFNLRYFKFPNIDRSIRNWNVLQAILRRATHVIDTCFLAMLTSLLVALVLVCSDVLLGSTMSITLEGCTAPLWFVAVILPLLPKFVLSIYVFYYATSVTEKCARTPALINSFIYGEPCDGGRQFLVEYIQGSAAGFYVQGVRVTTYMLIKGGHLVGMLIFTCMARMSQLMH